MSAWRRCEQMAVQIEALRHPQGFLFSIGYVDFGRFFKCAADALRIVKKGFP